MPRLRRWRFGSNESSTTVMSDFQASAGIQGRQFAEQCDQLLTHDGFELRGHELLRDVGVEIDRVALSPRGNLVWFEYKGSVQGSRPGLMRTDTLKKAIANGALLAAEPRPPSLRRAHIASARERFGRGNASCCIGFGLSH